MSVVFNTISENKYNFNDLVVAIIFATTAGALTKKVLRTFKRKLFIIAVKQKVKKIFKRNEEKDREGNALIIGVILFGLFYLAIILSVILFITTPILKALTIFGLSLLGLLLLLFLIVSLMPMKKVNPNE